MKHPVIFDGRNIYDAQEMKRITFIILPSGGRLIDEPI
jgi:hypothetical protein